MVIEWRELWGDKESRKFAHGSFILPIGMGTTPINLGFKPKYLAVYGKGSVNYPYYSSCYNEDVSTDSRFIAYYNKSLTHNMKYSDFTSQYPGIIASIDEKGFSIKHEQETSDPVEMFYFAIG